MYSLIGRMSFVSKSEQLPEDGQVRLKPAAINVI
jgi:hypothetical protein